VINALAVIVLVLVLLKSFLIELIFLCKKKLSKVNNELMTLSVKVIHLQKTLNQMNCCTTEKINCFAVELSNDNDEMKNENNFLNIQQFINSISSFF